MKWSSKHNLKGYTIAELLIVLVLTSISITLSYGTLTYVQKLFSEYKKQNKFLNELTDLKKRLNLESLKADLVTEENNNVFMLQRDSSIAKLEILENSILVTRNNQCDTFHFTIKNLKKEYVYMLNPLWSNKLIASLDFETEFKKQTFKFHFTKEHSASLKLFLEEN